jgi:uncharacterized protein YeaO (DUF488 family)
VGDIRLKRAYDASSDDDGVRVLVERLWPRGVGKADAALDAWMKDIAPSPELRKWYGHDRSKWDGFRRRYRAELDDHPEEVAELRALARQGRLTLVLGARDVGHSSAMLLKEYLEEQT